MKRRKAKGKRKRQGKRGQRHKKKLPLVYWPNTRRAELRDGLLSEQELRAMARFAWLSMSMRVHVLTGVPDRHQWHLCKARTMKAYHSSHKRASLRSSGEWTGWRGGRADMSQYTRATRTTGRLPWVRVRVISPP
jgi:hypothetical protein